MNSVNKKRFKLLCLSTVLAANIAMPVLAMEEIPITKKQSSKRDGLRRSNRGSRQLVEPSKEDVIDKDYIEFLSRTERFNHVDPNFQLLKNPMETLLAIKQENNFELRDDFTGKLPPGRYAELDVLPFLVRKMKNGDVAYPLEKQGWKLHVSARNNARIILEEVLKVIDQDIEKFSKSTGPKYTYTYFKVSSSMEAMRTMNYVLGNLKGDGRETQAGKFITIYPINKKHARFLAKAIDDVLNLAIRDGKLELSDFFKPLGEALVGTSGAVSVRYGNMSSTQDIVKIVKYVALAPRAIEKLPPKKKQGNLTPSINYTASDTSLYEPTEVIISDDRYRPWPDFMNLNNEDWTYARDPFRDLGMRYTDPVTNVVYTWKSRPHSWPKR